MKERDGRGKNVAGRGGMNEEMNGEVRMSKRGDW